MCHLSQPRKHQWRAENMGAPRLDYITLNTQAEYVINIDHIEHVCRLISHEHAWRIQLGLSSTQQFGLLRQQTEKQ